MGIPSLERLTGCRTGRKAGTGSEGDRPGGTIRLDRFDLIEVCAQTPFPPVIF